MDSAGPHQCDQCGSETTVRPVPRGCRGIIASDPAKIRLCRSCLAIDPATDEPIDQAWRPGDVTGSLPRDPDTAIAVAVLVDLLDSLALNREEIVTVVEYLESMGTDPVLAVDRLAADPHVSPHVDLGRRRDQLAQVLDQ